MLRVRNAVGGVSCRVGKGDGEESVLEEDIGVRELGSASEIVVYR